jgi:hypothetical protein
MRVPQERLMIWHSSLVVASVLRRISVQKPCLNIRPVHTTVLLDIIALTERRWPPSFHVLQEHPTIALCFGMSASALLLLVGIILRVWEMPIQLVCVLSGIIVPWVLNPALLVATLHSAVKVACARQGRNALVVHRYLFHADLVTIVVTAVV